MSEKKEVLYKKELLALELKGIEISREIALQEYKEGESWDNIFNDESQKEEEGLPFTKEGLLDAIEEIHPGATVNAKTLKDITDIQLPGDQLEEILNRAKCAKYERALKTTLWEGGKYEDLLKIEPKSYGLPESWEGSRGVDKYSSILWAISWGFYLEESYHLKGGASPRLIAERIEAPLSVIMDVMEYIVNGGRYTPKN